MDLSMHFNTELQVWDPLKDVPEFHANEYGEKEYYCPFIVFHGPSESGKTMFMAELINIWKYRYPQIYLVSGGDTKRFDGRIPPDKIYAIDQLDDLVDHLKQKQNELPGEPDNAAGINRRVLLIWDDGSNRKDMLRTGKTVPWLATAARHLSITCMFAIHRTTTTAPVVRENARIHVIAHIRSIRERDYLRELCAPDLTKAQWNRYMRRYTSNYSMLVIDGDKAKTAQHTTEWMFYRKANPVPRNIVWASKAFWGKYAKPGVTYPAVFAAGPIPISSMKRHTEDKPTRQEVLFKDYIDARVGDFANDLLLQMRRLSIRDTQKVMPGEESTISAEEDKETDEKKT